jgi:hypothetical protein
MKLFLPLVLALAAGGAVYGDIITVDPVNYQPAGTVLTTIVPQVTLHDANGSNAINTFFKITSYQEPSGSLAGLWDFADGGIAFYNSSTKLYIGFNEAVTDVQIDFVSKAGVDNTATGTLNVYDSSGDNLGEFTTSALADGQSEVMDVSGLSSNAAYAVATGSDGGFGRLTNLQVTTAVPEPGSLWLCLGGLPLCLGRRRRA